jgi:hypothetical protein
LNEAKAMIMRTEFPFGAAHPNPAYGKSNPVAEYEKLLKKVSPARRSFVMSEGARLSEFADKASYYTSKKFRDAYKVVGGLVNEINTGSNGAAGMTVKKLSSHEFLKVIGDQGSYATDRAIAAKLGVKLDLPVNRGEALTGKMARRLGIFFFFYDYLFCFLCVLTNPFHFRWKHQRI